MGKSASLQNSLLKLLFNGTPIAGLADNAAAGALATLYLGLHTADPGTGGAQTTNETAYTGYVRQAVGRTAAALPVTGNAVNPAAAPTWNVCTGAPGAPLAYFSIGTSAAGAGLVLYSGPLDASIVMAIGVIPQLTINTSATET